MKILRVAGVLLLLGVALLAWPSVRDWRPGFVEPTALAAGESPMQALCRIRAEFLALPEPVHDGFTLHERWERKRFAAYTSHFGPYWEIDPSWSAWRFARRYSRLEIVAAIGPYMGDPQLAPKVAAILAGLPVGSRQGLERLQTVSSLLAEPSQFVPGSQAAAPWSDAQLHFAQSSLAYLYGAENTASRLQGLDAAPAPGTLEGALLQVLADHGDPQRWPRELAATALFPYALDAAGDGDTPRDRYIRLMGREAAYPPLHAGRAPIDDATAAAHRRETSAFARSLCRDGQPRAP